MDGSSILQGGEDVNHVMIIKVISSMEGKKKHFEGLDNVFKLHGLINYQEGAVVSRTLLDKDSSTLTVFAFDEGQRLSEHTAPHDALVQVLDGKGRITIEGEKHEVRKGESITMPADIPHAVEALTKFKMFLIMIK
ncbi:MAG: cupin domain-containing protein [Candidatus Saliniplasma sp.]